MQPPPRAERSDYDQALKWMLTQAHDAFLSLFAPELIWIGERSPEVPAVARRADLVWEVERPGCVHGLLHVELQVKAEEEIGERLAEYAIRLWRRDHLPVRSLVVFLREAPSAPESPFVIPWGENDESLRYRFEIIHLWEIPQERMLASQDYSLWPLSVLMAGATPETTMATAERLAGIPAPRQERSDLIGVLLGLAGGRMPRGALLDALRRNHMLEELLKESGVLQALAEEYAAEAVAKSRAEALAEGHAEGRAEGERDMARIALEGRFGPLPEDVLSALRSADLTALTEIVAQLATISLEQVRARLGLS